MIHFIHQLAYYITFEVMECSWDDLIKRLRRAESLDEVIEAHEDFLQTLLKKSLLDDESRDHLMHLRAIYDRILEFQSILSRLYVAAIAEAEARFEDANLVRQRERSREYGTNAEQESLVRIRKLEFSETIKEMKSQMKIVSQSYQDMVRTFLLQLAVSGDRSLQCLSFRVDFNQHYKKMDARLHTPLTFQHSRMRESMQGSSQPSHVSRV
jgi:gamma-tubulin complex component 3